MTQDTKKKILFVLTAILYADISYKYFTEDHERASTKRAFYLGIYLIILVITKYAIRWFLARKRNNDRKDDVYQHRP